MAKKMNFLIISIFLSIFAFSSCTSAPKKAVLVGPDHTFRDLRQHTFSSNKHVKNTWVDVSNDGQMMAFVMEMSGNQDIYIKGVNSKAMTQKTFHKSDDSCPAISPDGKKLAFATKRNGNWDIFVMNMDGGSAKRQITSSNEHEIAPSWSADSTKIAYCRLSRSSGEWEIWTFDLTNGALTNLVPGKFPDYHPKENIIVFQRPNNYQKRCGWYAIWTIDDEGKNETVIISSEDQGYITPDWGPDGNQIVFASGSKAEKAKLLTEKDGVFDDSGEVFVGWKAKEIWTINRDGTNFTQLTSHRSEDWSPKWSDNGRIFFVSERDSYENIWSVMPEFVQIDCTKAD